MSEIVDTDGNDLQVGDTVLALKNDCYDAIISGSVYEIEQIIDGWFLKLKVSEQPAYRECGLFGNEVRKINTG